MDKILIQGCDLAVEVGARAKVLVNGQWLLTSKVLEVVRAGAYVEITTKNHVYATK
ncbi:MAG: hypothetical protein K6G88_10925 [Lachnospiraceae bacterium]|nr:hypothetical protein [Lachnospiraceae bacterium]